MGTGAFLIHASSCCGSLTISNIQPGLQDKEITYHMTATNLKLTIENNQHVFDGLPEYQCKILRHEQTDLQHRVRLGDAL